MIRRFILAIPFIFIGSFVNANILDDLGTLLGSFLGIPQFTDEYGQKYCWYDDGWQGPGWYLCGFNQSYGSGWGGGEGWRGYDRSWRERNRGQWGQPNLQFDPAHPYAPPGPNYIPVPVPQYIPIPQYIPVPQPRVNRPRHIEPRVEPRHDNRPDNRGHDKKDKKDKK